jgi:hypothetical protein
VLSAAITALLTAIALDVGVSLSPRVVGVQLKGPRGRAYLIIAAAFAIVTGAIIGIGLFATRNGADWTPFAIAAAVVVVEMYAFVLVLVSILRRLARKDGRQ